MKKNPDFNNLKFKLKICLKLKYFLIEDFNIPVVHNDVKFMHEFRKGFVDSKYPTCEKY